MFFTNFANFDTTSPGKIEVIKWQIKRKQQYYGNKRFSGKGYGTPGSRIQCDRHVEEYKAMGILPCNQTFVEIQQDVHDEQKSWKKECSFRGNLIFGDICDIIPKNSLSNVNFIDFDGVTLMEPRYVDFILDAGKNNVNIFILVLSNRAHGNFYNSHRWLNQQRKHLNLPERVFRYGRGEKRIPLCEIQVGILNSIAKKANYDLHCRSYAGYGGRPMLASIFIKGDGTIRNIDYYRELDIYKPMAIDDFLKKTIE